MATDILETYKRNLQADLDPLAKYKEEISNRQKIADKTRLSKNPLSKKDYFKIAKELTPEQQKQIEEDKLREKFTVDDALNATRTDKLIKHSLGFILRKLPLTAAALYALTPAPVYGGDKEIYDIKREGRKVPGGGSDEAFLKRNPTIKNLPSVPVVRKKKGGGKIKKNYAKGGGVRSANY